MHKPLHIVILAAGEGTRMKSMLPKVLHRIGGRPMLIHLLETASSIDPAAIHVVVGSGSDQVRLACSEFQVNWVIQLERRGTGHAVAQAMPSIPDDARVMVLLGDHPLIPVSVLRELTAGRLVPLTVLTMELAKPRGYGRIERDRIGRIAGIVEDRDATPAQRSIKEVNTGIILSEALELRRWLEQLGCDNSKQEYYLTDIFAMARSEGKEIHGVLAPDPLDLQGANDRRQMAVLEQRYRQRAAVRLMEDGVQIIDPARIDVRGHVRAGQDVCIDINVVLEGNVELGDRVSLGPGCLLKDCELAAGTVVHAYSVLEGVRTKGACEIGPFARLRPGTELSQGSRIGNFVEVKNSRLGENSKANHLSYVGDAEVGDRVNIGAGTITCNYDGANKHPTIIEDDVFIGSNTELIAPVTIARGATIGAGSTISQDAPAAALTLSRVRQTTVPGWKRPQKKEKP
ncbi:MAG: UDP-N-acetylglucosamine diphosphorylase/glucosamine-1-phosphate N-acetyltransferase [Xanthomonadales bacterium]|nr:UDP-N-acetylglucosamine diphosphorylase/glucosamine-1-phosphate N-acetyltransferase [Xanthomonadales bacterium]